MGFIELNYRPIVFLWLQKEEPKREEEIKKSSNPPRVENKSFRLKLLSRTKLRSYYSLVFDASEAKDKGSLLNREIR